MFRWAALRPHNSDRCEPALRAALESNAARAAVLDVEVPNSWPPELYEVELGYGVLADFQRQGYATEAVKEWLTLAFADPSVRTVVGQTLASLTPSIGVLEKTGFPPGGDGRRPRRAGGEQVVRYELSREE